MTKKYKREYYYRSTANEEYWNEAHKSNNKRLTKRDKKFLRSVRNENGNNKSMAKIHANALKDGLYIPCLTELVGDCMFESIEHTGFCKDRNELRKSVAILFYLFGNCKIISSYIDEGKTLKDIFELFNDIEYVYCYNTNLLYKYTYYTMCSDMYNSGSWSRLPTELILTVLSVFFKVRFHIYHDNGHIDKICDNGIINKVIENEEHETLEEQLVPEDQAIPEGYVIQSDDDKSNIYLALIGENHYVPLIRIPAEIISTNKADTLKCPKYDIQAKKFRVWAQNKADKLGLYSDVEDSSDNDVSSSSEDDDNNFCQREKETVKKDTNVIINDLFSNGLVFF
jgi:hypothetical protein